MFERERIIFQPLRDDDLSLMFHWLRNTEVSRWYGPAPESLAELQAKYGTRIDGYKPIDGYIIYDDKRPVGYIQKYPISHEPDYAEALNVDPDAAGIDVFIGEDEFRHQGFGPIMLQEFVQNVVFSDPAVSCAIIAPEVSNVSAIHSYEKAGFRHIKTVSVPGEDEPEYVMIMWRSEIDGAVRRLKRS